MWNFLKNSFTGGRQGSKGTARLPGFTHLTKEKGKVGENKTNKTGAELEAAFVFSAVGASTIERQCYLKGEAEPQILWKNEEIVKFST